MTITSFFFRFRELFPECKAIPLDDDYGKWGRMHKCQFCDYKSYNKKRVIKHQEVRHLGAESTKECMCSICGKEIYDRGSLKRHVFALHRDKFHEVFPDSTVPQGYSCTVCGKEFNDGGNFKRHVLAMHREKFREVFPNSTTVPENDDGEGGVVCDICGKKYKHKESLRHHHKLIHEKSMKLHSCEFCKFKTTGLKKLEKHIDVQHSQSEFVCDCGKKFKNKGFLKSHIAKTCKKLHGSPPKRPRKPKDPNVQVPTNPQAVMQSQLVEQQRVAAAQHAQAAAAQAAAAAAAAAQVQEPPRMQLPDPRMLQDPRMGLPDHLELQRQLMHKQVQKWDFNTLQ